MFARTERALNLHDYHSRGPDPDVSLSGIEQGWGQWRRAALLKNG
ncbi:paREP1, degenerate [Pyrobaculum aerophilum str. IM2]|uniref:PaREP1, degenerate n=1 Tax=Pyrobaculum aerophilum (strain ATCC 51768 / DSM 7523 / JCM 9630 / CIP 104966 / NBRC 100827 / IM2) TaxID=178306 RepID=Q8ZZ83_PYRAE|nr:paREP1, degenerate [Pyrobaculum aerophilum str. IM2]